MAISSIGAASATSPISDVLRTAAKPFVDQGQSNQTQQSSTVVKLSSQAQALSQSLSANDRPGSTAEASEPAAKEASESATMQLRENESVRPTTSAASAVAAYSAVAAQ